MILVVFIAPWGVRILAVGIGGGGDTVRWRVGVLPGE